MPPEKPTFSILHIIASVDRKSGGPIEGIFQIAMVRDPSKTVTHIASLDPPGTEGVVNAPLTVHALGSPPRVPARWRRYLPWLRYGYQSQLVPWLKANVKNYDVVVVNGLWNYATFGARRALVGSGVPYVVFTHGMLDPWFKRKYPFKSMLKQLFWLFCEGPLLHNAAFTLFTTEEEKIVSRDAFWPYCVRERVVGYGSGGISGDATAQKAAFRTLMPKLGERRYLLFLSRIHAKKGCDLLVEAFARVATDQPDLDLVIAGPDQTGWRHVLEARARALRIAERVHWPGMLVGDAKWGAYRGCEAFVLPSHQENFGIVVAEAMSAGKPVLLTDKVNIWREVEACGGGLVEPDDLAGVTRLLRRFVDLPTEPRVAMGAAARDGFLTHFEINRAAQSIERALMEAVS